MEAIMSIIGVVAALLLVVSSACIIVYSVRGAAVVPASVTAPQPLIYTPQSVNTHTADQEELRRYFLQGRPDGRVRYLQGGPDGRVR
jgi:hypothetical protein